VRSLTILVLRFLAVAEFTYHKLMEMKKNEYVQEMSASSFAFGLREGKVYEG
jgi:hypothetical protein